MGNALLTQTHNKCIMNLIKFTLGSYLTYLNSGEVLFMSSSIIKREDYFLNDSQLRDKHVTKTEVLDKVKVIVLLPNGVHLTTQMVADYYEVDVQGIRQVIQRHRDELVLDGIKTLAEEDLKKSSEPLWDTMSYS